MNELNIKREKAAHRLIVRSIRIFLSTIYIKRASKKVHTQRIMKTVLFIRVKRIFAYKAKSIRLKTVR